MIGWRGDGGSNEHLRRLSGLNIALESQCDRSWVEKRQSRREVVKNWTNIKPSSVMRLEETRDFCGAFLPLSRVEQPTIHA